MKITRDLTEYATEFYFIDGKREIVTVNANLKKAKIIKKAIKKRIIIPYDELSIYKDKDTNEIKFYFMWNSIFTNCWYNYKNYKNYKYSCKEWYIFFKQFLPNKKEITIMIGLIGSISSILGFIFWLL